MLNNTSEFTNHKEQIVINKLTELLLLKIDNIKIQFDNVIYINNFKLIHFEFKQQITSFNKRLTCVCIIHDKYPDIIFMIGSNHKNGVYVRKCATFGGYRLTDNNILYSSVIINDKIDIFCKYINI